MSQAAAVSTGTGSGLAARTATARTLDDLAAMDLDALADLYARGSTPARMSALDGDRIGRMLRVRRTGPIARPLARFAASAGFPWGGKSFRATGDATGTGINRVRLWGRHRLFPFATFVGTSVLDGRPAIVLDYDQPENPDAIRHIHDEVREVAPGLFLGPACWKVEKGTPALVLWFALSAPTAS